MRCNFVSNDTIQFERKYCIVIILDSFWNKMEDFESKTYYR